MNLSLPLSPTLQANTHAHSHMHAHVAVMLRCRLAATLHKVDGATGRPVLRNPIPARHVDFYELCP